MATPEMLRREIKALAFDQYGTIVDMQKGLTEAVTPFLKRKGWDGKPNSFVTWWRRTHFENSMIDALCDRGHTPYREIGQRAVAYVMDRCGIGYTADEVRWSRDLGRGGRLFQAALEDLRQGRRDHRAGPLQHSLRRQSRLRLHRGEILWHAHGVHRPAQAAVRPNPASTRSGGGRFRRTRRRPGLSLPAAC